MADSKLNRKESSKSLPETINNYIAFHRIDEIVNQALNKVIREKPSDPLSSIAGHLIGEANNSLPVFDKFKARKVLLYENSAYQTIKIQVFLNFQGRTDMRYEHILAFDQEEQDKFLYDNKAEKTGVDIACEIINTEINELLAGKVIETINDIDGYLQMFYQKKVDNQQDIGWNIIKGCSEAILYGAASCFEKVQIHKGIAANLLLQEFPVRNTKLMLTLLNGGKTNGSAVKFQRFYLIIDAFDKPDLDIVDCFLKFQQSLRKAIQSTKQGEAGFKPTLEGSYFNAFGSINESFKAVEDAINASGANSADGKAFKIGINCEGDSYFNKDPKDANKYEVEAAKNQHDQDQLTDYYLKVCNEHPLVSYVEDPFANNDIKGYQKMTTKFKASVPHVKIGIKAMIQEGGIQKLQQLTQFQMIESQGQLIVDPNPDTNKDKFTPSCINVSRSQFKSISEMLEYLRLANQYPEDKKFTTIIDDNKFDSTQSGIIDLAFGSGCEFLNVKGFFKTEKLAKVMRYAEVVDELRH